VEDNTTPHCTLIIGCAVDKIFQYLTNAQGNTQHCTTEGTMNLIERMRIRKATATHSYRGKWQAAMVVSTLKATRKGKGKIKTNLHTGQYAGSVSPGPSHGKTLVEPQWCSLGSPDTSTSFFARPLKKGHWTCHTHQWSQLSLVESRNCFGGHDIFEQNIKRKKSNKK